jgi:hypothetical protein
VGWLWIKRELFVKCSRCKSASVYGHFLHVGVFHREVSPLYVKYANPNERLLRFLTATPEQQAAIDRILRLAPLPPEPEAHGAEPTTTAEPFITKAELGKRLNRDVRTMTTWMRKGLIPYYKIEHSVVFKWSEVEKQLAATCRVTTTGAAVTTANAAAAARRPSNRSTAGGAATAHTSDKEHRMNTARIASCIANWVTASSAPLGLALRKKASQQPHPERIPRTRANAPRSILSPNARLNLSGDCPELLMTCDLVQRTAQPLRCLKLNGWVLSSVSLEAPK